MTAKRKTYNITEERQTKLEMLAIEISSKLKRQVRWTDIMSYLVDHHAKAAAEEIIKARGG
jgi:hypothetical protein